jgi:hypothetical protein
LPPAACTGNQCARIFVPSNDVTSTSVVDPATCVACTGGAVRGGHAGRVYGPPGVAGVGGLVVVGLELAVFAVELEQPAAIAAATTSATDHVRTNFGNPASPRSCGRLSPGRAR